MKRYMIPIVLGVALVLGGVLLYWHFVINQVLDRNGMENPFPPDDTELPGIPMDAALLSLNWSQSAIDEAVSRGAVVAGGFLAMEKHEWKEDGRKILYNTQIVGEFLGEEVSPWAEITEDENGEITMMEMIRLKRV